MLMEIISTCTCCRAIIYNICLVVMLDSMSLMPKHKARGSLPTAGELFCTPSILNLEVVLDKVWVKHWKHKSSITFKLLSLQM